MTNSHVILIGSQSNPMLVSDKMEPQASRIAGFLESLGTVCVKHSIDPYNMAQVESVCYALLEDAPPGSVVFNATGGAKVAAFGAFAVFRERGFPIIYFDL